ncbi:MAG: xanthine dehydrogenase family protein subunit M [Conexivisphaerales archaeon]
MSFGSPYFTLPRFRYEKPDTLEKALSILQENRDDARILAGGVGLLNLMKERLVEAKVLVDIKGIKELHKLEYKKGQGLTIGSTVTLNEILEHPILKQRYTALYQAISTLSDNNLRNRSTLVGDLCEALPWIDSPAPLIAFDASVNITGPEGYRSVKVESFIKGMAEVDLAPVEIVTSITLPEQTDTSRSIYLKFARGTEFGLVNLAVVASNLKKYVDRSVRIVYSAIDTKPVRALEAESVFKEDLPPRDMISRAVEKIRDTIEPMSDNLASGQYRKHLMQVMTYEALTRIFEGA